MPAGKRLQVLSPLTSRPRTLWRAKRTQGRVESVFVELPRLLIETVATEPVRVRDSAASLSSYVVDHGTLCELAPQHCHALAYWSTSDSCPSPLGPTQHGKDALAWSDRPASSSVLMTGVTCNPVKFSRDGYPCTRGFENLNVHLNLSIGHCEIVRMQLKSNSWRESGWASTTISSKSLRFESTEMR
jgi:hypothetical protein